MEPKTSTMTLAGREFKITNSPISSYANGCAVVSLGDTVIMANALMNEKGLEGADFFPMTVDYEENMYAAGKIKGSRFIKREGRPSENATLISRMIDRPVRPLFPKGTTNEVQLICSALSVDMEVDPATTAMNAASVALLMSGAPFEGPLGAVRVGYKDGKIIINPTYQECEEGQMNLIVAGTLDAITMVEAGMKEVTEEVVLEALAEAHKHIKEICQFQLDYVKGFEITKILPVLHVANEELIAKVAEQVSVEELNSISGTTKKEVKAKIHAIEDKLFAHFANEIAEKIYTGKEIAEILNKLMEKNMRKNILEKEIRLDGRKLTEVRPISIVLDVLPRTHGSAIFQRGETTALTITTLGGPTDAQIIDTMDKDKVKNYMHHYHFPSYATGEIKRMSGPNRREIGHGDLAERALVPVLPDKADFPYTMWLVSEIIKCNGSSSMASVCGSTLSLMCAGVPIKKPVAGIAMGLVSDKETGAYKILSDIQGMEDFAGDMDFKVTGTRDGITALQMDIKIKGLQIELLKNALAQAKEGRDFIMAKMVEALPEPRKVLSKYAPLIMTVKVDPDMIRVIIGKGGETIQRITAECDVEMDISDEGIITITAPDQEKGNKALDWIGKLTYIPKVGDTFEGKITRVMDFGAFVEFVPGKEGLVHISELDTKRVNKVEDVVKLGDVIKVKLMQVDDQGRYNFSRKALLTGEGSAPKSGGTVTQSGGGIDDEMVEGTQSVRRIHKN